MSRELLACVGALLLLLSAIGLLADGLTAGVAVGAVAGALMVAPMARR